MCVLIKSTHFENESYIIIRVKMGPQYSAMQAYVYAAKLQISYMFLIYNTLICT